MLNVMVGGKAEEIKAEESEEQVCGGGWILSAISVCALWPISGAAN